jgi:putative peptidoglycan lipid II flippase
VHFLAIPATFGLIVLASPVVSLLFERGRFTAADSDRVAGIVILYAAGLWCYCANQIQVRAFYAKKETKTPAKVSGIMVALNLGLTLALVGPLKERGIALANSVTGLASFVTLGLLLRRRFPDVDLKPVRATFVKSMFASIVMAAAAWGTWRLTASVEGATIGPKLVRALVPVAAGIAAYLAVARLLRMDEARLLRRRRPDANP